MANHKRKSSHDPHKVTWLDYANAVIALVGVLVGAAQIIAQFLAK